MTAAVSLETRSPCAPRRVAEDAKAAVVLIDWKDRESFDGFVADMEVKATMRFGGATRPPKFTFIERAGRFDA